MQHEGPLTGVAEDAERILRTLPMWFGIEESLQEYVRDTAHLPTFVARDGEAIVAFITLREHFPTSWEVHCLAVEARARNQGVGRSLHAHVEGWLASKGARFLQVKTLSASSSSKEYAETRAFYLAIGYTPLEEFPLLWGPRLPVLQLVKAVEMRPNPSLEGTRSGMALGPPTGVVHHPSGGPSAMPALAPQLKR